MLFCEPSLMGLYSDFGFREIADPVWVQQPGGQCADAAELDVEAAAEGAEWPPGELYLDGEPF